MAALTELVTTWLAARSADVTIKAFRFHDLRHTAAS
jgi:hypothetical protein